MRANVLVLAALGLTVLHGAQASDSYSAGCGLGVRWDVLEGGFTGTWVRRGSTNTFDATWQRGNERGSSTLTMSLSGNQVTIQRQDAASFYGGGRYEVVGTIGTEGSFHGTNRTVATGALDSISGTVRCGGVVSQSPSPPGPDGILLDFSGTWSMYVNGFKGELYLKQQGTQIRGWMGVNGVNIQGDVIAGTVTGNEILFTRNDPSLARPQEYRGYLLPHDNPRIDPRFRMTGVDALAGIGSHVGVWNMGWFATRLGPYREEPPR